MPTLHLLHRRWFRAALLAGAGAVLGACVAASPPLADSAVSDASRASRYQGYRDILLLPPREDPRNVVPRTVGELESMGFRVRVIEPGAPIDVSVGTGFLISASGYLLTCAHVVGEDKEATVTLNGTRHLADVVKSDRQSDIALLKLRAAPPAPVTVASFRATTRGYGVGEEVFTIGYPLGRIPGNGERVTRGLLGATNGDRDHPRLLPVSAQVPPGNSGGPLLDREGFVIGMMRETINPWRLAPASGSGTPPGTPLALTSEAVLDFVKSANRELFEGLQYDRGVGLEAAGHAVARIQAGIVADAGGAPSRMVVRLAYLSVFDIWYRFRFFVLSAFDFETQEPLFVAGQGRDNRVSNEDVVMKETFDQFRHALRTH